MNFRRALTAAVLCWGGIGASLGHADCTSPAGRVGQVKYASNYGSMAFCNGTHWISMAGGVSVTVGGSTGATTLHALTDVDDSAKASGTYLKYNGTDWVATNPFGTLNNGNWCTTDGTSINCSSAAPVLAEVDPKVGTLTNGNWCTTDGSAVNCATAAPVLTEVDPKIGSLTNGKWCTTDGSTITCTSDAPVATESDPEVDSLTASNFCQANGGGTAITCTNDAAAQRTALGLGTMATQNADAVAITGGTATLTGVTAANVTATVALSAGSLCDENGANCKEVADIGTSDAQGDRIISSTHMMIVNEGSGYVSLTADSGSTSWGYFGSLVSYVPKLWTTQISSTFISATTANLSGDTFAAVIGSGGNAIVSATTSVSASSDNTIKFATNNTQRMMISDEGVNVTDTISTTALYVNGVAITANGGTATAASSTGAVQFNSGNALAGDDANLFWDDTNNRLGVGVNNPGYPLVVKNTSYTGTTAGANILARLQSNASGADATLQFSDGVTYANTISMKDGNILLAPISGKVGIGTSSPAVKLHLYDSATPQLRLEDSTNNVILAAYAQNNDAFIGNVSNHRLDLGVNNTPAMSISTLGNVGIGTSVPDAMLHISGTTAGMLLESSGVSRSLAFGGGNTFAISGESSSGTSNYNSVVMTAKAGATGTLYGLIGQGNSNGAALTSAIGVMGRGYQSGNGALTSIVGLQAENYLWGSSGAVTNSYGVNIAGISYGGGATSALTNSYGLHISSRGYGTNRYAIYSAATDDSYFAGDVGINDTTPDGKLGIVGTTGNGISVAVTSGNAYMGSATTGKGVNVSVSGASGIGVYGASSINTGHAALFHNTATGYYCYLGYGGSPGTSYSITCSGTANIPSDIRLKKDIETLTDADGLLNVMKLRPISYRWKDPKKGNRLEYGFVAQEIEKVFPSIVGEIAPTTPEEKKATAGSAMKILAYDDLIAPLVKAVQQLKHLFDADHDELVRLKAANDNLRATVAEQGKQIDELKAMVKAADYK